MTSGKRLRLVCLMMSELKTTQIIYKLVHNTEKMYNLLGGGIARLLRRREKEQIKQLYVLHQHDAQLIEQDDQSLFDVSGEYLALTGTKEFQQRPQKRFVHQHLMSRVAD